MKRKARENIFVFGASGHAKVVIDVIERQGCFKIAFLVDDDPALKGKDIYGYPVLGGKDHLLQQRKLADRGIIAIGDNRIRMTIAAWLFENDFGLITAIHPSAQLARGVSVGAGTVIMAGAVVNSDSCIGDHVIVNTQSSIDHDCTIGDYVHVAPGATLCGTVDIGEGTFVCAGAVVIPNLTVGRNVTIGAGSTVICDVLNGKSVVGSPARVVKGG